MVVADKEVKLAGDVKGPAGIAKAAPVTRVGPSLLPKHGTPTVSIGVAADLWQPGSRRSLRAKVASLLLVCRGLQLTGTLWRS